MGENSSPPACDTKYPILLVHGIGFRDNRWLNYWGRIPGRLKEQGAVIFYGEQDSHGSVESNGRFLCERVKKILEETGAEKVNVIAHSKGGLDSRWMIAHLDHGKRVASLTTIATPHHGSRTVDLLLRLPDTLVRFAAFCCDVWYRVLGDRQPDAYKVFHMLSTKEAREFNAQTPDAAGVYYQSYAFAMKKIRSDLLMWLPCLVVRLVEGINDGLVTPESAGWGDFRGVFTGTRTRGISHCDEVDLRRRPFDRKGRTYGNEVADITEFYCGIVEELKEKGF